MTLQNPSRWRLRAALFGAVTLFCIVWAAFLAVLVKRAGSSEGAALGRGLAAPASEGLIGAAAAAAMPRPEAAPPPRPRAVLVEHDEVPLAASTRHLLRGIVPRDLAPEELRRILDEVIDAERLDHPQVDAVGAYLYEEAVYSRFAGRVTPLEAAVAHATWAPGGDWTQPARAVSGLDNRTLHVLPRR